MDISIKFSSLRRSGKKTLLAPPPQAVSAGPRLVCPDEEPLLHAKNWRTVVPARRCNSAAARPIRHARVAVVILPTKRDVLLGHVIKRDGRIPRLERIAGIFRKVRRIRCSRNRGLSIDRWQQHQVASRVVDLSTTQRPTEKIEMEPEEDV